MEFPGSVAQAHGLDGARKARGSAVIIDVFRFSTTVMTLLGQGAHGVVVAADPDDLATIWPHVARPVVFSELDLPMQHYDNSPTAARHADIRGLTAVSVSSNGSRVLAAAATGADEVLVGGFANATAVVDYLWARAGRGVTLVAAGLAAQGKRTVEDDVCSTYLRSFLCGESIDFDLLRRQILAHPTVQTYLRSAPVGYVQDVHACLALDSCPIVPRLGRGTSPPTLVCAAGSSPDRIGPSATLTIKLGITLPASTDQVWEALTDPGIRAGWWGAGVELDLHPGGRFREEWMGTSGTPRVTTGQVWVSAPGSRLALSWAEEDWKGDTLLLVDLLESGGETRLELQHSGWERLPGSERLELSDRHRTGWRELLRHLRSYLMSYGATDRGGAGERGP